ncbi:MAG: hypothetical protein LBI73_04375 [Myroides sp.]|jgi:hypothetical protein|nr:hypothetical protein [Myroides sp.]
MKKIAMLFAFVATTLLAAGCEGPSGPQGPPGPNIFPHVQEVKLSFDQNLESKFQSQSVKHPVELYKGDVVLVYVMDSQDSNGNPVWSPLPRRFFVDVLEGGSEVRKELEYSYVFSPSNVLIEALADAPLKHFNGSGKVGDLGYLKNMYFRLVYIPGQDPQRQSNNVSKSVEEGNTTLSYEEAVRKYNLEGVKVVKNY